MLEISSTTHTIHGERLQAVHHSKYLGIELPSGLNWDVHFAGIIDKAKRCLGFMRRNLNQCPENVKEHAYLALVRPQLDHGCCTWHQHIQKQIKDIESVQRRAARFVKNEYSTTPGTVMIILNDLKWPTLEKRKKVARLTMMFKVVSSLSAMQFPPYISFKIKATGHQAIPP